MTRVRFIKPSSPEDGAAVQREAAGNNATVRAGARKGSIGQVGNARVRRPVFTHGGICKTMAEEKDLTKLLYKDVRVDRNKTYKLSHEGKEHTVKLVDIKELGPEEEEGRRIAFSLLFEAKRAKLEQGVYTVENVKLGTGDLLLVPLYPGEVGKEEAEIYEAVFA